MTGLPASISCASSTGADGTVDMDRLYVAHIGWLRQFLRRKLGGDVHQAADLAQDTFVRLLMRPRTLTDEPRAYLSTIARGLLVDHWRRQTVERAWAETLASQPPAMAPSAEDQAIVIETLCQIDAMLARLADKPRRAFVLSQIHEMTYREIGEELGVSERMVKKYMAQAMLQCLLFQAEFTQARA